jgi:hypothetical protein
MTVQQSPFRVALTRKREPITFKQVIGPSDAQHMIDTMSYEHQRQHRPAWVQRYADEMRNGTFRALTQIFVAIYRDQHVVLDGQHRLRAVVASGVPHLFTIVEQEVESEEELAQLYATTDIGGRRTPGDIYGAYALAEEFGINKSTIDRMGGAIRFMLNGCLRTGSGQLRADAIIPYMRTYAPYMRAYIDITSSGITTQMSGPIQRASTIAAALLTLRFSAPKAEKEGRPSVVAFWEGAIMDDGLKIGDPRKVAYRHLIETRVQASNAVRNAPVIRPSYSLRYLGSCFNTYMRGHELRYAKVFDDQSPVDIYGVPKDPALWW